MRFRDVSVVVLVALPWLNPFSLPPSPVVVPWLLAAGCGVLLFVLRSGVNSRQLLAGLLLAATLNAAIGLLQYAGWSTPLGAWLASAQPGEAYGNLRQRNQFATLMNIGLAAALWLSITVEKKTRGTHLGLGFCAVLLAAANAASASRTGMLELCLLLILAWVWDSWWQPRARQILQLSLLAYGASSLLLPNLIDMDGGPQGIWSRLQAGDSGCNNRTVLWSNVLQLIAARPWAGWGWGELDYAHFVTQYVGPRFCDILDNAHNLPLHIAVELGIPVAVLLGFLGLVLVWRAHPWLELSRPRQAAWAILSVVLLHSMLEYPLWYGPFQLACLICLWVLHRPANDHDAVSRQMVLARELAIVICAFIAIVYACWDYQRVRQLYLPPSNRAESYKENTLEQIRGSYLFQDQVMFAEFTTTPLVPSNAELLHAMGQLLLHYSPEPTIVAKLIDSARMLGNAQEACWYETRFSAAYPDAYQKWKSRQGATKHQAQCSSAADPAQPDLSPHPAVRSSNGRPVQDDG